jgi:hypothetical protein
VVVEGGVQSLVGLLRYLGAGRATGLVTLTNASKRVEVQLRNGRVLLADSKREAALAAVAWLTATYTYQPGAEVPTRSLPKSHPAWSFAILLFRRAVLEAKIEALKAELPEQRAPRLAPAATDFLGSLNLTPAEHRFVERYLDGKTVVEELARCMVLSELSIVRMLYLLHVLELVEWIELEQKSRFTGEDALRLLYQRRAAGDLFGALGAHCTDAPSRIRTAYENLRQEFGPGSPAQQCSKLYSEKIVQLAGEAWKVLGERASRQEYRRDKLRVNGAMAAGILAEKAKWADVRCELQQAQELLEAALDLHPTPEYAEAFRALGEKRAKAEANAASATGPPRG